MVISIGKMVLLNGLTQVKLVEAYFPGDSLAMLLTGAFRPGKSKKNDLQNDSEGVAILGQAHGKLQGFSAGRFGEVPAASKFLLQ